MIRLSGIVTGLLWAATWAFPAAAGTWTFSDQTVAVNLDYSHVFNREDWFREWHIIAGGLGIGDLNNDGWDDIFAVTGYQDVMGSNPNPNKLFISDMDGTFSESAAAWGLSADDRHSSGPLIADFNGDGWNDLLLGGVGGNSLGSGTTIKVYLNDKGAGFIDGTVASNLDDFVDGQLNFGMAASDIDKDGDLDLAITHWVDADEPMLFRNNGSAVFTDITNSHMNHNLEEEPNMMFTPTFADINGDGWDDLMLSSDFLNASTNGGGSRYFLNDGSGTFEQQDNAVLTDENGMGSALGDYDNDGDLDWYITSIWDPDGVTEGNWGVTGNRLYENNGSGVWTDVTPPDPPPPPPDTVRHGYWGWGDCWADFNNDMHLDLYHVNGFPSGELTDETVFDDDPARMFINNGDGTFTEQSAALGVDDTGEGRAILCFDNDRDGDLDIMVNNSRGDSRYFRNDLDNGNHWIVIRLVQSSPNHHAVGAKIFLTAGGVTQMRQLFAGGNFESSHPTAQHFGLGSETSIDLIQVTWPDGTMTSVGDVPVDQYFTIDKDAPTDVIQADGFEQGSEAVL